MNGDDVVGQDEAGLIAEDELAIPNPTVEVSELLPDGTELKAVWSLLYLTRPQLRRFRS